MKLKDIPLKPTAVSVALIAAAAFLPMLAVPALMLSVYPQVIMLKSKQYRMTALSWGVILLLLAAVFNTAYAFTYLVAFIGFAVLVSRVLLLSEGSVYKKIGKFTFSWLVLFVLWQGLMFLIFKINALQVIFSSIESSMATGVGRYYSLGYEISQIELMDSTMKTALEYLKSGFFGWVTISALFGSYFLYYVLSRNTDIKEVPEITKLRPDESLVWFLIASAALYISGSALGSFNFLTVAGANGLIVLLFGYLINGTGIFSLLAAKLGMGGFLKVIFLAALIIFFRGIVIITAAGILDTWFNFRKYTEKTNLEKS